MQSCGERHNEQARNYKVEILDKRLVRFHTSQLTYGLCHMVVVLLNNAAYQNERPKYQGNSHATRNKIDGEPVDGLPGNVHDAHLFLYSM